jgi:hypothetical protein
LNKDSKRRNGKTGADSKDIQKQLIHMCWPQIGMAQSQN